MMPGAVDQAVHLTVLAHDDGRQRLDGRAVGDVDGVDGHPVARDAARATVSCRCSAVRLTAATLAPLARSPSTSSRPMPSPAPVTTTVVPATFIARRPLPIPCADRTATGAARSGKPGRPSPPGTRSCARDRRADREHPRGPRRALVGRRAYRCPRVGDGPPGAVGGHHRVRLDRRRGRRAPLPARSARGWPGGPPRRGRLGPDAGRRRDPVRRRHRARADPGAGRRPT